MRNPFIRQPEQPFLSPLVRQRRFPAVAAPLLLTVCGGVALVIAFGTLFGLQLGGGQPTIAQPTIAMAEEIGGDPAEAGQPAATVAVETRKEEPALVTALPQAAAEQREPVLEPILPPAEAVAEAGAEATALAGDPPDPGPTAAIPPSLPAEISALVPAPRPAPPAVRAIAAETQAAAGNNATPSAIGLRPAVVNQAVNMRAAPNKGAQVVMVVPGGAAIDAETDCGWCEIRYQGRSGFIYRSFVKYR